MISLLGNPIKGTHALSHTHNAVVRGTIRKRQCDIHPKGMKIIPKKIKFGPKRNCFSTKDLSVTEQVRLDAHTGRMWETSKQLFFIIRVTIGFELMHPEVFHEIVTFFCRRLHLLMFHVQTTFLWSFRPSSFCPIVLIQMENISVSLGFTGDLLAVERCSSSLVLQTGAANGRFLEWSSLCVLADAQIEWNFSN